MIGLTLARYFFQRHVLTLFWFLAGVSALAYIIDFTEFTRRTSGLTSYSALSALGLSGLRLPFIIQQVAPFVSLFAAMSTLIVLNRRHELVVARSTGVSAWQFLLPIALSSFLFGLFNVAVLNPLGASGMEYAANVEATWRSGKGNETTGSNMPWIRQKVGSEVTIIGAHSVLGQGSDLRGAVFMRIGADLSVIERIDAKRAVLGDGAWELADVTRRAANGDITTQAAMQIETNLDSTVLAEKVARPEFIAVHQLASKIRSARAFGYSVNALRMQFHSLMALPMLMVAMSLVAATASLRFIRLGQSLMLILGGIVAGFLLYVAMVLAKAFGAAGIVAPEMAAWFPVAVAMFFGVTYLLHREDG